MAKQNRSNQVYEELRSRIVSGQYAAGDRFFSNNTLAEEFSVSAPTASMIISMLEQDGLVTRQRGKGTFILPNKEAREVANTALQNATFAIVAYVETGHPNLHNIPLYHAMTGFERALSRLGGRVKLINLHDTAQDVGAALRGTEGLAGVFFLTAGKHDIGEQIKTLCERNKAAVVWSQVDIPEIANLPARCRFDSVCFNNEGIGAAAAQHLLDIGCKRPLFLASSSDDTRWVEERRQGFLHTLEQKGIDTSGACRCLGPEKMNLTHIGDQLWHWRQAGFDGILAENDNLAAMIHLARKASETRIPQDLKLMGVDDSLVSKDLGLTTFHMPGDQLGEQAVQLMATRIQTPELPRRVERVDAQLLQRNSTTG